MPASRQEDTWFTQFMLYTSSESIDKRFILMLTLKFHLTHYHGVLSTASMYRDQLPDRHQAQRREDQKGSGVVQAGKTGLHNTAGFTRKLSRIWDRADKNLGRFIQK
jgi:hypothetical protein